MVKKNDEPENSKRRSSKTERKPKSSLKTAKTPKLRGATKRGFPIVGVGASAGGLEALQELFKNLPSDSGMAFVVVQHLDPSHTSLMPELLSRSATVPIHNIESGMKVRKNNIYVIPKNKYVALSNGILQLSALSEHQGPRLPVDFFFRSLASDQGPNAIGIILSGTGADGTLGLRSIKAEEGLIIVQDPETAKYDGMPRNAIATNLVDVILTPSEIPKQLIELTRKKGLRYVVATEKGAAPMQKIHAILRKVTKHDFSGYKEATIQRRIAKRMNINKIDNIANYVQLLQDDPQEASALFKDILISVTSFFRDPEAFASFQTQLLKLLSTRDHGVPIRAWVPGCSSGEEVYSIAIATRECLDKLDMENEIQIFGTDVDEDAINTARAGIYPAGITADVSPERLKKFFIRSESGYAIRKDIRESLVFAVQDITRDPPFSKVDVVCCRNLLIYLNTELQKIVLPLMHYSLNRKGLLFLGPSETIGTFTTHFTTLDNKWKIYERIEVPNNNLHFPPVSFHKNDKIESPVVKTQAPEMNIPDYVHKTLLAGYTPTCIVIDQNQNILYIHGKAEKYLQLQQGIMTTNVSKMGREGLKHELSSAIRKAINTNTEVPFEHLLVKQNGGHRLVNLIVKPLTSPQESQRLYLVIFQDVATMDKGKARVTRRRTKSDSDERMAELEKELQITRDNLQTTIEELETSNEELKSANEELQSTNEELQSTNEELETSREELQSVNEELLTVNSEHQTKIDELSKANNDIKNLLEATKVPTILLDSGLCIRRFTSGTEKIFNIISSDVGRPIRHLTTKLCYGDLVEDAEQVLDTLIPRQMQVKSEEGLYYSMAISPYRTTENVIAGIIITFTDITSIKELAEEKSTRESAEEKSDRELAEEKAAREVAEAIVETVREPLLVLDNELHVVSANKAFYDTFEVSIKETTNRFIYDLGDKQWDIPRLRQLLEEILPRDTSFNDFMVEHDFLNVGYRKMLLNARRVQQEFGKKGLILLTIEDVTGEK